MAHSDSGRTAQTASPQCCQSCTPHAPMVLPFRWTGLRQCRAAIVSFHGFNEYLTMVNVFSAKVSALRNPLMMNPPKIHLISEIPDPAAYGANALTKKAAVKEKSP